MTQEQKTKIGKHFDELHTTASGLVPNVPDDLKDVLKASYLAGAGYALDIYCPQWISVEEELPKIGKDVLILRKDGEMQVAHQYNEEIARWWSVDGFPLKHNITHWMPLPQAPKKGGEQ